MSVDYYAVPQRELRYVDAVFEENLNPGDATLDDVGGLRALLAAVPQFDVKHLDTGALVAADEVTDEQIPRHTPRAELNWEGKREGDRPTGYVQVVIFRQAVHVHHGLRSRPPDGRGPASRFSGH